MEDEDVDAYFAKHDIQSVVSDILYELGYHRPESLGPFLANYVERRFGEGPTKRRASFAIRREEVPDLNACTTSSMCSAPGGCDAVLVESKGKHPTTEDAWSGLWVGGSKLEQAAGQILLELRRLRKKYHTFSAQEFEIDYQRLLQLLGSSILWSFCRQKPAMRRRLAASRGLFEAHRALNEEQEEQDTEAGHGFVRVDNCLQLARALPPGRRGRPADLTLRTIRGPDAVEALGKQVLKRLMDIFQSKLSDSDKDSEDLGKIAVLEDHAVRCWQQMNLHEGILKSLVEGHGPFGPEEITADADEPAPGMQTLKGLFSGTANQVHGSYLREANAARRPRQGMCRKQIAAAAVRRLERSSAAGGGATWAELRLPLHAEGDAWVDLARWSTDLPSSSRTAWVVQLPVTSYAALKGRRAILDYGELLDNAFGPLVKLAMEEPHGEAWARLKELLSRVVGFEVSACLAVTEPLNGEGREPSEWAEAHSPPLAYQLYHVWARLKGLNCARSRTNQKALELRAAASSPDALACAYMLGASVVSGCGTLSSHAPLQYLFMLDRIGVAVSQCSKRSLASAGEASTALQKLFMNGLRVALCTEDPAVSHWSDDPLGQEYGLGHSAGFSKADLSELARNSRSISNFEALQSQEDEAESESAEVGLRVRYRHARRQEEMDFLSSLVPDKDQSL
ncbi:unnamed protein product [Durusdinium trenchii]|uniref:Uncharacterized protein n=1 Tax=Durusdinium trenchii TaxID=1381693 RepID=A0ABP0HLP3_9DINO